MNVTPGMRDAMAAELRELAHAAALIENDYRNRSWFLTLPGCPRCGLSGIAHILTACGTRMPREMLLPVPTLSQPVYNDWDDCQPTDEEIDEAEERRQVRMDELQDERDEIRAEYEQGYGE